MGYAEFWYRPMKLDEEVYRAIDTDVDKLKSVWKEKGIRVTHLTSLQGFGENNEIIHETEGIVVEGARETFIFPRIIPEEFKKVFMTMKDGRIFQFVTTGRGRYNLAVQAILIIAKHHLKEQLIVTSNGEQWDWSFASELVQQHLGYGGDFVLDESPSFDEMSAKISWTRYVDGKEIHGDNFASFDNPEQKSEGEK